MAQRSPRARRVRPLPALLRLAWRADARGLVVLFSAGVFGAVASLAGALAVGVLLNSVVKSQGALDLSWVALVGVAAIFLVQRVLLPFLGPIIENLEHRLTLLVRELVMTPLLRPSTISHLEDPAVADHLRLARQVGSENFSAQQALGAFNDLATLRLAAVGSAVILARWELWAPAVLGLAWLASRAWYRHQMATLVASMERSTPALRRADYLSEVVLSGRAAKDLRIFGLGPWLVGRYQENWLAGMTDVWRKRRSGRLATVGSAVMIFGAHLLVLGALVRDALGGAMGIGDLFVYLQTALGLAGFGFQAENEYVLRLGTAPLPHVLAVDALVQGDSAGPRQLRSPGDAPERSLRLDRVSFTYPGSDREVLTDLDLTVPAGRSLAIVGENGAGKTTLVNLLCGFYRPTGGRVLVDGTDLAELDPVAWQRRIAAVFQDFARYPVSVRENITFGRPRQSADYGARVRAAERAGLVPVVEAMPDGWRTVLSREYEGGGDLSGGQWQRVALARALFALETGAKVLVLDEPTANLDVRAEADLYDRFLELTAGLTTILVSHRFSTVRRADRIVVLDAGAVVEAGNHDELIAAGGRYARMFSLQARYYVEEQAGEAVEREVVGQ